MPQIGQPLLPVTVLPPMPGIQQQAAAIQATLQQQLNNTILQGNSHKLSVKSGSDSVGGSDHNRVYVKGPQEVCFIGPSSIRVRCDELIRAQLTAGITAIAAQENNPVVQKNMFSYLASILQDLCDFGFKSCLGPML